MLLVHPTVAVKQLYDEDKVPNDWWTTYRGRQAETREATFEVRVRARAKEEARKVVKLIPGRPALLRSGGRSKASHQRRNTDSARIFNLVFDIPTFQRP